MPCVKRFQAEKIISKLFEAAVAGTTSSTP